MLLIKPDEVNTWAARTPVDDDQLASMAAISSAMVEAYLGRPIEITEFRRVINLGPGMAGFVGPAPIVDVSAVRLRMVRKLVGGGIAPSNEAWVSLSADDIEGLIDSETGRCEFFSFQWDGYRRFSEPRRGTHFSYQAEITFTAGYVAYSEATATATISASAVTVEDGEAFTVGTKITVGPYAELYTIQSIVGDVLTLTSPLANAVAVGDEVAGKIPSAIRAACGAIIEDLQTWLPNSDQQKRTLSVIEDFTKRTSGHPIPPSAAAMLAKYKRWSWI